MICTDICENKDIVEIDSCICLSQLSDGTEYTLMLRLEIRHSGIMSPILTID